MPAWRRWDPFSISGHLSRRSADFSLMHCVESSRTSGGCRCSRCSCNGTVARSGCCSVAPSLGEACTVSWLVRTASWETELLEGSLVGVDEDMVGAYSVACPESSAKRRESVGLRSSTWAVEDGQQHLGDDETKHRCSRRSKRGDNLHRRLGRIGLGGPVLGTAVHRAGRHRGRLRSLRWRPSLRQPLSM